MTSYESKMALFLVLLVLFLAVVSFQSVELSRRSQIALDAELERRMRDTAAFVEDKLAGFDLEAEIRRTEGAAYVAAPRYLMDLEVRYGLAGLTILDAEGTPLLASEARERSPATELYGLPSEASKARLRAGEPVVGEAYREAMGQRTLRTVYRPLHVAARRPGAILAVTFEAGAVASLARHSTILLAYQVVGFLVLLVLLWFFVRWFLRPYRAMMSTARAAGLDGGAGDADETDFVVATFRETIARLKDREEELRRLHLREKSRADEQARLASHITRSMASGVVVFSRDGRLDFMNRAAEEVLHVEAAALAGAEAMRVFQHAPDLGRLVEDSFRTGETHPRCEVLLKGPEGERALGASTFPILDDAGAVAGALALLTDLTDVKSLQERMRLRENLASLGEMSAGIAHEFRNALAAILGYASLLERKVKEAPALQEDVRAIRAEAEGLNRIVSDFLRFARPIAPMMQLLDLKRLTAECIRDLKGQPELSSVVFDHQDLLPVAMFGDEVLMKQALGNLLRNGAEAALGVGRDMPKVAVRGFRDPAAGRIRVAVEDNGPGIPEGDRERVFLPFFTTKDRGTGLGLATTQKIILAHDGEIHIEGVPGEGATFVISIPDRAAAALEGRSAEDSAGLA